jgi:hypothetical protein
MQPCKLLLYLPYLGLVIEAKNEHPSYYSPTHKPVFTYSRA